mmetsp:Transcript_16483/g.45324  ORF Transcript_16483/g.45324 Transcript_16483/m.45324 type:complete len:843 (-) Transcript_16483:65-2593(-)
MPILRGQVSGPYSMTLHGVALPLLLTAGGLSLPASAVKVDVESEWAGSMVFLQSDVVRGLVGVKGGNGSSPQWPQPWLRYPAMRTVHPEGEQRGDTHSSDVNSTTSVTHKVEHVKVLNKMGLWWLMGTMILVIAIMVIRMDASMSNAHQEELQVSNQDTHAVLGKAMHLLFCVVGLNTSMLFWGIAQEYMMTSLYEDTAGHSEKLPNSFCLVLFNRIVTVILSAVVIWIHGLPFGFPGLLESGLPASSNLIASWCQYESLSYVSFPLQTATKSAKLLPVLILNSLRGKRQNLLDYAEAIVIVSAIVVFGIETDHDTADFHARQFGIPLLCGLLLFDSITPHFQDALFKKHPTLNTVQMTFAMSLIAAVIMLVVLLCSGQLFGTVNFFSRHPEAILQAFVLSLCSTLTQFLISYTIKHFGPVVFTIIATTRQVISVCTSAVLFMHHISTLAWLAAVLVFGTVIGRALRPPMKEERQGPPEVTEPVETRSENWIPESLPTTLRVPHPAFPHDGSFLEILRSSSKIWRLFVCVIGIHVPLGFYSVAQEFMATHTFDGYQFRFPMFLIAANRTGASLLAIVVLKIQGLRVLDSKLTYAFVPAGANFAATLCQYKALYYLRYPAQTLMKSVKVLPVMMCGRLLKNRSYSYLDYGEAVLITGLVCFFTWNFNNDKASLAEGKGVLPGILLMLGYIASDSFTSNSEDIIFQRIHLDPGQVLLGMQAFSGVVGWSSMFISGQFVPALRFLSAHSHAWVHVAILVMAEACGAYACTVTVRLFGPAVFTLLLISHQLVSLLVSVALFNHEVSWPSCLCLAVVALVVLTSSLRRVSTARSSADGRAETLKPPL